MRATAFGMLIGLVAVYIMTGSVSTVIITGVITAAVLAGGYLFIERRP